MKVDIRYTDGRKEILENVYEIHFGYPSSLGKTRIAFEGEDTGCSYFIDEIDWFEVEE